MVVILIVAILASVTVPLIQYKIKSAKWSEANAAAGTIRSAVSTYVARNNIAAAQTALIGKKLDNNTIQSALGFTESDLTGTYFVPGDYEIAAIDAIGHAAVTITASQDNAPEGTKTLNTNGDWQ